MFLACLSLLDSVFRNPVLFENFLFYVFLLIVYLLPVSTPPHIFRLRLVFSPGPWTGTHDTFSPLSSLLLQLLLFSSVLTLFRRSSNITFPLPHNLVATGCGVSGSFSGPLRNCIFSILSGSRRCPPPPFPLVFYSTVENESLSLGYRFALDSSPPLCSRTRAIHFVSYKPAPLFFSVC